MADVYDLETAEARVVMLQDLARRNADSDRIEVLVRITGALIAALARFTIEDPTDVKVQIDVCGQLIREVVEAVTS